MPPISVKIKCSNETAFSITVDSTETVSALKTLIEKHFELTTPTPSSSQRLIFAGKVLKDDDTLENYKLQEGNTVHLVRGNKPAAPKAVNPTPSTANVTAAATPSPANPTNNLPTGQQNPFQMFGMPPMNPMMNAAGNPFGADPLSMMNNPMFAQMMSQMMSNPQMLDQVIGTNPQLASMITPDIRQQMQSPEFLQLMSNPQMIQQMLQMTGGMGGMGAGMNPLANIYGQMPPVNSNSTPFNPAAIAGMFGGQPAAAPTTPAVPPEQLYQTQLAQLQDMGFYSPQENIRALQMTGGNVEAAVEWLFSRPPGQM